MTEHEALVQKLTAEAHRPVPEYKPRRREFLRSEDVSEELYELVALVAVGVGARRGGR